VIASKRLPNFSIYAKDAGLVNGAEGPWHVPTELPSKDWGPIRESYWGVTTKGQPAHFRLGAIEPFARFFAASRSVQAFTPPDPSIRTL